MKPLYLISRTLRSIGADSFVLGIGKNVSIQELRQAVQNRQNVFLVQTFKSLPSIKPRLAYEIIQRTVGKFGKHFFKKYSKILVLKICVSSRKQYPQLMPVKFS